MSGVLAYKLVAGIVKYREMHALLCKTIDSCLSMVNAMYVSLQSSIMISHTKAIESKSYSSEEKKIINNEYADVYASIELWYKKSLELIEENIPKEFHIVTIPREKK